MNIILIGMAGSGKTSIGKKLAEKLERKFIDMDNTIEKQKNMTISEIVKKKGWEYFRTIEHELVIDLVKKNNAVIATGGGVVINPGNMKLLSKNGRIIFLETPVVTLISRIKKDGSIRPLFLYNNDIKDQVIEIYKHRFSLYKKSADKRISTRNKNVDTIVQEIISVIS